MSAAFLRRLAWGTLVPALLLARSAHAENYSVSPALLKVLDRADAAVADAEEDALVTFFAEGLLGWSRDALTAVAGSVGVENGIIQQEQALLYQTACQRVDVAMLEAKMEEVREKLNGALEAGSVIGVIRLTDLYKYLSERKTEFAAGALDPTLKDAGAVEVRLAGPNEWEEQIEEGDKDGLCYFHSDYLPPSLAGYGCDVEALQGIQESLPEGNDELSEMVEDELEAIEEVQRAVEEHLEGARTLAQITAAIDAIALGDAPDFGSDAPREHRTATGCALSIPDGAVRVSKRGNFSTDPDDIRLTRNFIDLRESQEEERPYSSVVSGGESSSSSSSSSSAPSEDDEYFSLDFWTDLVLREPRRIESRDFTREQARDEAAVFAVAGDPVMQIQESLGPLRNSVGELARLATGVDGGLRGFVRDMSYFLLRTCMERPCRKKLERVARIAFADECFPHVNGKYLTDTCEQPRWQLCEYDAYDMEDPPDVDCSDTEE